MFLYIHVFIIPPKLKFGWYTAFTLFVSPCKLVSASPPNLRAPFAKWVITKFYPVYIVLQTNNLVSKTPKVLDFKLTSHGDRTQPLDVHKGR